MYKTNFNFSYFGTETESKFERDMIFPRLLIPSTTTTYLANLSEVKNSIFASLPSNETLGFQYKVGRKSGFGSFMLFREYLGE